MFKKKKLSADTRIVVSGDGTFLNKTGYTRLRDNFLYLNADGNNKVVQIESAVSHEGKTTVACNLSVSLALTGKKVVVLELDFNRPRVHRAFKISGKIGIADYMIDKCKKSDIIIPTEIAGLNVVPRGTKVDNSALIFISEKFKNFIKELREEYDYVILDCAPILLMSDYIHISEVSDGILFLVAHAKTSRYQVADAVNELKKNNIKILGSAFTMYNPAKGLNHTRVGYYSYYGSSPMSDNDDEKPESAE